MSAPRKRSNSGGRGDYKLLVSDEVTVLDADADHLTDEESNRYIKEEEEAQPSTFQCVVAFLTVVPVFAGYACGVALQQKLKKEMKIGGSKEMDQEPAAKMFTMAVTLLTLGNLVFRLGHNVVFFWCGARLRVCIAISSIMVAMFILSFIVFVGHVHHISLVFISYGLIGLGIGSFESNLLAEISGLGRRATLWAVSGMPVGFMLITIVGIGLTGVGMDVFYIYLATSVGLLMSLLLFIFYIPHAPHTKLKAMGHIKHSPQQWLRMILAIAPHSICLMIDMFSFSLFCPQLVLYIFQQQHVVLNYHFFTVTLRNEFFIAFVNIHTSLGDTLGRKLVYLVPEKIINLPVFPFAFLAFTFTGIACNVSYISSLTPIGCFFIALGNGTIYAQSCRYIHSKIQLETAIFALSIWLFVGDFGSVTAYFTKDIIESTFFA